MLSSQMTLAEIVKQLCRFHDVTSVNWKLVATSSNDQLPASALLTIACASLTMAFK